MALGHEMNLVSEPFHQDPELSPGVVETAIDRVEMLADRGEAPRMAAEGYFNRDELRSEIKIEGDSLKIIGFQGSGLRITYNVDKPIARFNTNEFIQTFFDSPLTQTVAAIIIVALIALFFNREKVSKKIENFIVEHSELEQFEEEEL